MGFKEYVSPILHRWWLVLSAVLIATVSCLVASRGQPAIYQARATLMVGRSIENPNPSGSDISLTQQLASTYTDIVKRDPIQNAVKASLQLAKLPEFSARVVPNTQLIELSVKDSDPARTAAVANEMARQLILLSPTGTEQDPPRQAFINQQLDELEAGIKDTRSALSQKQGELAGLFSARQIADTQNQITALQNKLTSLQANYAALLQSTQRGATNTLKVIEPAAPPTVPVGPNRAVIVLLAAVIGLVVSVLGAYLMDYLDDTIKSTRDVEKSLGLDTLAAVPVMRIAAVDKQPLFAGHPQAADTYAILRTNLQFASVGHPLRTLVVTSPGPDEGKSTIAANISVALAQVDQRVVLIDADLRRPKLHRVFGLTNNVGLTSALLQKDLNLEGVLQTTDIPNLRVLTSGPLPPNPSALLSSARMRKLLETLNAEADILVLDSPPAAAIADAAILGVMSDGVLVVLRAGMTRRRMAEQALNSMKRVSAHVVGAVLNRVPSTGSDYYYYSSRYYNQAQLTKSKQLARTSQAAEPVKTSQV